MNPDYATDLHALRSLMSNLIRATPDVVNWSVDRISSDPTVYICLIGAPPVLVDIARHVDGRVFRVKVGDGQWSAISGEFDAAPSDEIVQRVIDFIMLRTDAHRPKAIPVVVPDCATGRELIGLRQSAMKDLARDVDAATPSFVSAHYHNDEICLEDVSMAGDREDPKVGAIPYGCVRMLYVDDVSDYAFVRVEWGDDSRTTMLDGDARFPWIVDTIREFAYEDNAAKARQS